MTINRIAKYETACWDDGDSADGTTREGFIANPLAARLTQAQIQMYQAAFLRAQQEQGGGSGFYEEWSI